MATSTTADPTVLSARRLGEAWKRANEFDRASIAAKDDEREHTRIGVLHEAQQKRCDELAQAACFAPAETLEGAQVQLTIAACYANDLKEAHAREIRAALASALAVMVATTGKTAIDLCLHAYSRDFALFEQTCAFIDWALEPGADADILRLAAEWREAVDANEKTFDATQRPDSAACARMRAIEAQLLDLPAKTAAGVVAKLQPLLLEDLPRRELFDQAIADLERMAKGGAA
jgi:hypothetical protein